MSDSYWPDVDPADWTGSCPGAADEYQCEPLIDGMFSSTGGPVAQSIARWNAMAEKYGWNK